MIIYNRSCHTIQQSIKFSDGNCVKYAGPRPVNVCVYQLESWYPELSSATAITWTERFWVITCKTMIFAWKEPITRELTINWQIQLHLISHILCFALRFQHRVYKKCMRAADPKHRFKHARPYGKFSFCTSCHRYKRFHKIFLHLNLTNMSQFCVVIA